MLRHHRDAGLDDVGELDVVEADMGDRLVQFEVVQCLRRPDGDDVLGRGQRRRPIRLHDVLG